MSNCKASLTKGAFILCSLSLLQVDYHHDEECNLWNVAAKKRILLEDGNNQTSAKVRGRPLAEYCVSLRRVSDSGTRVSSLGSNTTLSSNRSGHNAQSSGETTVAMRTDDEEAQVEEEPQDAGTPMEDCTVNYEQEKEDPRHQDTLPAVSVNTETANQERTYETAIEEPVMNIVDTDETAVRHEEVSAWINGVLDQRGSGLVLETM